MATAWHRFTGWWCLALLVLMAAPRVSPVHHATVGITVAGVQHEIRAGSNTTDLWNHITRQLVQITGGTPDATSVDRIYQRLQMQLNTEWTHWSRLAHLAPGGPPAVASQWVAPRKDVVPQKVLDASAEMLRNYNSMRKRVGAETGSGRFLVAHTFGGLGNRRAQSLTYLLLALLSDRVLVLRHQPLGPLVPAFAHSQYFALPEGISSEDEAAELDSLAAALKARAAFTKQIDLGSLCCGELDFLFDKGAGTAVVELAHNPNESTLGFFFVEANRRYASRVSRHFGRYFGYLGSQYLLQPAAAIAATIDQFKKQHFRGTMVGLHIRWGRGRDDIYFDSWSLLHQFWQCALSAAWGAPSVRFFVATDSNAVLAEAKRALGADRVVAAQLTDRAPEMAWAAAMVDLQLLSECDMLVGTGNSSFTVAAHQSALLRPHIVRAAEQGCQRALHSQLVGVGNPLAHHTLQKTCADSTSATAEQMRVQLKYFV